MWRVELPRVSMPRTECPRAIRLKVSQLPVSAMRMSTALGGVGIHPVEVLEVGRELRFAEEGVGVTAGRLLAVGVGCIGVGDGGRAGKHGGERDRYAELHRGFTPGP